mgnify:CR=1 FL=1
MRLFGFYYTSVGSIILFFIIATIISYPFSLLADVLPKALLMLEKIDKQSAVIMYLLLDTFATFMGLRIVVHFSDYYFNYYCLFRICFVWSKRF